MCELQVSHVQMLVPLDLDRSKQELLKSQSSGITLSISMAVRAAMMAVVQWWLCITMVVGATAVVVAPTSSLNA